MARYTRTPVSTLQGINNELAKVELAMQDTLDLTGSTPNYMDTNLDMNSRRILNLPLPLTDQEPLRRGDIPTGLSVSAQYVDDKVADAFALKIFQSPTAGGLTEIQTRTVNANEVYEVRKTSDNLLATIYSDAAGTTEIVQDGIDNVSGSDGVVEFYIADGGYQITANLTAKGFYVYLEKDFESLQSLIANATAKLVGSVVGTSSYYSGWAATVGGAQGGAKYQILTAAQYGSVPDGVADHYVGGGTDYVAQLIRSTNANAKQYGALLDGTFDDAPAVRHILEVEGSIIRMDVNDAMFLSKNSINANPIMVKDGAGVVGGTITTDLQITFGVNNDIHPIQVDAGNTVWKDLTFDLSKTITGASNGLGVIIRFTENSSGFFMRNITVKNMYCEAYVYALAINANARGWKISKISFENLDVKESGVEGDLNGSLRGVYVGYQKVGNYDNQIAGQGTIKGVTLKDLLQYEDTDGIQIIGTTGHVAGDFVIRNVNADNVGKRAVKAQHEGVLIENVYADAQNITHSFGYMFSIVAALNDSVTVRRVRGRGKFKAPVSTARTVTVEDVDVTSTAGVGEISGTWAGLLHDFGGTITVRKFRLSGNWNNHIFIGASGFTSEPVLEVDIDDFSSSTPAEQESIRIDSSLNGASIMTLCKLGKILKSETSATNRSAIRIGREDDLSNPNIQMIQLNDINAKTNGYFTTITANSVECDADRILMEGAYSSGFEVSSLSRGGFNRLRATGEAFIANISSCTNTLLTNSTTSKTSGGAVRYNNSSDHAVIGLFLETGVTAITTAGTSANIKQDAILNK